MRSWQTSAAGLILALSAAASAGWSEEVNGLRTVDEFDSVADETARSQALFQEMAKVIQHPRCLNCHPADNTPRQGMDMHIHEPPVVRGDSDFGAPGMTCNVCHSERNVDYASGEGSIPGHSPWMLAPIEQAWIGKTVAEICTQLKDPQRNGGRTLAELHEHNAEDGLVGWGWEPGTGREPAPGTQEIFGELTLAWIETGAACPAE